MSLNMRKSLTLLAGIAAITITASAAYADGEVNIYSSRHYDTDERLYSDFTEATGIKVNRIEGNINELIERAKAEGENSPADVFITTDAGRLFKLDQDELLSETSSDVLDAAVPANLRHPDGKWFGISQRARVIFYDKERVSEPPQTYADLADPKYKGQVCARSSSNIYMLSLMASQIANNGEEAAKSWASGLLANFAREPQGGDTDQLRGIVSGECDIAVGNTYYFARALRKEVKGLSGSTDAIGWVFPDQDGNGTHVNISGAGVTKYAPNRENAVKFLEYLTSESAQNYFAAGNDEYPVLEGVALSASVVQLGTFKADDLNLDELGKNQARAQEIYNEIGYK
ncbi:MAG: Fe(3+) ABC transporter substrate-binding protein [Lentilitoribacter sp.]